MVTVASFAPKTIHLGYLGLLLKGVSHLYFNDRTIPGENVITDSYSCWGNVSVLVLRK